MDCATINGDGSKIFFLAGKDMLAGRLPTTAGALIKTLDERGIAPVIPNNASRSTKRKTDFALFCDRNLVERFFGKHKGVRAIATRYATLASRVLAAMQLVSVLFWLNSIHIAADAAQCLDSRLRGIDDVLTEDTP